MKQHRTFKIVVISVVFCLIAGCHTDPNVRKRKYLASGERYSAEGKYNEAAIQLENSLKADKSFPDAHYALAKVYLRMGAYLAAYREFSRTVELQPSNYNARIDLGNLLIAEGKTDDAEKQAKLVLAQQQNNPDVHALLSAIALKRGDRSNALTEIQRALALAPNRPLFYDDLALLQAKDPKQITAAESNFKRAVALDPKSVDAKLLLSNFYVDTNRLPLAEQESSDAISTDPKSIAARTSLAQVYLRAGDQAKAETVLRKASQDLSDNPHGVSLLADYYVSTGQYDKARTEFASLVTKYPKSVDLQKGYLRVLLQEKDYQAAQNMAAGLMKDDSRDPEIAALNGIVLLNKGDLNGAVNNLQSGARNFPSDAFIEYWLGMAELAKGDIASAQKSLLQALALKPNAIDAMNELARIALREGDISLLSEVAGKAIAASPNFAGGYIWRAMAEMHQNSADQAEADLKTAIRLSPQSSQAYFELGRLRFSQKRYQEGESLLEQSLQYDPNFVEAARLLVGYDLYRSQPDKAVDLLNAEIQKSPTNSGFLDLLAEMQIRQNHFDLAASTAQKAVQLNPSDGEAVMLSAQIAVQRGQTGNAIHAWQQWLNGHPNDANATAVLGTLEEVDGNKQAAETDYRRALQLQPRQPIAANNLAYLMLQNGEDADVALSLAQTARQEMPNSTNTADTLAWAYYFKGTYGFARELLEDALKTNPNDATMQYHLGMVYSKLKDKDEAMIHLKKAVVLGRGTPTGNEAQAALKSLS